jgi:hypothetical protein
MCICRNKGVIPRAEAGPDRVATHGPTVRFRDPPKFVEKHPQLSRLLRPLRKVPRVGLGQWTTLSPGDAIKTIPPRLAARRILHRYHRGAKGRKFHFSIVTLQGALDSEANWRSWREIHFNSRIKAALSCMAARST